MEPPKSEPDNVPNGTPDGADEPTHAKGSPRKDDRWLRSVVENSSEIVTIVDPDGTLRYASPAFGRVLGYDPDEAIGTMNVLDLVHVDDLPHVLEETEKALSEGGIVTNKAEYRFRHADGSWRWMESVGIYLLDDPHVGGVVVTSRDVTERKEAEERFRAQYKNLPVPTYTWRRIGENFVLVDYNDAADEFTDGHVMGLLESRAIELLSDRPLLLEMIRRSFEGRTTVRQEMPWRMLHTGEDRRFVVTCVFVPPDLVMVHIEDITGRVQAEERLRLQAQLLGAVGEAVIALDMEGRVVYWNRAAEEMYGFSAEEMMGRRLRESAVPEDLRGQAEEIMAGVRAGLSWSGEFVVRRRDGTPFPVEATNTPVFDENGEQVGVVGVLRDVTERKETEEALRKSEAEIFSVLESITDAFFALDREWRFTYVNSQAEVLFSRRKENLIGERIWEDPTFYPQYQRAVEEGVTARFEAYYPPLEAWYSVRAYPSESGISVYLQDITERRRAEERLREAEERYRTLVEQIPAVIYINPSDGSYLTLYISPQIEAILGYTPEEWIATDLWAERLHPDDVLWVLAATDRSRESGEPFAEEYRLLAKDESVVWVRDEAALLRDGAGEPLFWQGVIINVTERKEAEEALKESEERYRRRSRELALLHRVRSALAHELDAPDVLYKAVEAVAQAYGYTQVSAYLLEGEELVLQHQIGYERVIEHIPLTEGVSGRAVRTRRPVYVEDVSADPDFLGPIEGVTSEICVPLFEESRVVAGVLNVESRGGTKLTRNDLRLMIAVGEHVGVAVSRAQLHAQVRHSEERYRALSQNASDIVTLLSATGTVRYQSSSVERILGYRPEEMIGKNTFNYVHPDDLQRVEMAFAEGLKDPKRRPSVEYRVRHKNGSWRWLESVGTNLIGDPAVGGYVVNSRDITRRKRTEEALREAEERYRSLVERIPAVTFIDRVGDPDEPLYVSPQIEQMLGYTPEEWMAGRLWRARLHPDDRERILASDRRFETAGGPVDEEYRLLAKDGSVVWIREETVLVRDERREPLFVQGILTDVTGRRLAERALRESEQRFRGSFENAATGMALVGIDGRFLRVNRSLCEIVGYSQRELLRKTFQDITHPDDLEVDLEYVQRLVAGEIRTYQIEKRYLHKEGHVVWALLSVSLVHDEEDEPFYFISQIQDLSERKRMEEQLQLQVLHDTLTGLPNRKLFMDRLGHALERTRRTRGHKVAVLFMDLDGFKIINDSLGHDAGDLLLVLVTERLGRALRPEDTLARFGGDEFVVLLEDVENPGDAVRVARRITEELRRPFVLEGRGLFASASMGIALGDARTKSPEGLLRDADTAMYRAKDEHADYRVFDSGMYARAVERLEMENDLRRAVEAEEFVVHYQPIVDLKTGKTCGAEALVRWNHPERGLLNPDEFVWVAEENGLVVLLGEQVLEHACRKVKEWQEERPSTPPLTVSVNLSARQLVRPDLDETVEKVLRRTGLEASRLALDVTETAYVKALESDTAVLKRLRAMGVRVSIDDFGMGYSSLSYLKRLPADVLKIDKSFVAGLGDEVEDTTVVRVVIELAHTFGMEVIAEGVETWAQAALLVEMGCDFAQGYYFSEPLPPEEVPEVLAE